MINVTRREDTHYTDYEWIQYYSLFSFLNYFDSDNVSFGILAIFNEYTILPGHGFPTHPHQDMELIYIVLEGQMTHKDSLGNENILYPGDVHRISAGSGLARSAYNNSTDPLRYITIWLPPVMAKLAPSQEIKHFDRQLYTNKFFPVVSESLSGQLNPESPVRFNSLGTIYRAYFSELRKFSFTSQHTHQLLFVISGSIDLNGIVIKAGGHARVENESMTVTPLEKSEIILVDIPNSLKEG